MDKSDKVSIVNEALNVLYSELNDYYLHTDFPVEKVPHIAESILKLEELKGVLKKNDQ